MLIEQMGRDYLCRNKTRRHTIGTNVDKATCGSDIVKSTECLLMLDENEEYNQLVGEEDAVSGFNNNNNNNNSNNNKEEISMYHSENSNKKSTMLLKKTFNQLKHQSTRDG